MMDKALYQIAAFACNDVYTDNVDLGTTEFKGTVKMYQKRPIQVLAIAGTNEVGDWFKNGNLWSQKGIKKSAVKAAEEINANFGRIEELPLMVCGHSKGGAEAIAYKRLFGADWCVAFAPARCLRYWADRRMENTTVFTDPDDVVSKLAFINFGLPICESIKAEDDHLGLKISDHFMSGWLKFVA